MSTKQSGEHPERERNGACSGMTAVALENHPADSRVKIEEDGIVQTLSSRMGTGGGNVPLVWITYDNDIHGEMLF